MLNRKFWMINFNTVKVKLLQHLLIQKVCTLSITIHNQMRNKNEKSIQDYRKDIYIMKNRIKDRQQHLQDLRQKHADLDVFRDESYTFRMKIKILQCSLEEIKQKLHRYSTHQAYECFALNFSMLAFLRACQIVSISPEMAFRAVDSEYKKQVSWLDFASFMKQTLKMDSKLSNPFLLALDPQQHGVITLKRYNFFLQCFLCRTEQSQETASQGSNVLMQAMERVTRLILQRNMDLRSIWSNSQLNIATFSYGLLKKLEKVDILDCFACYCKCDPLKAGSLQKKTAIANFESKIEDFRTFQRGSVKLKK